MAAQARAAVLALPSGGPVSASGTFAGKLGLQQRVLPGYRAAFFDLLAGRCEGGLSVFAGQPRAKEAIQTAQQLGAAAWSRATNIHLFGGPLYLCLQPGIVGWLERTEPEALVLEANPRYLSSLRAIGWMHRRGRPVVGWGLGAPKWSPQRASMLQRMDALIAYSSTGAQQYRELGIDADRVFVAPNAVTGPPPPLGPARLSAPRDHARPLRVLFVGRLQPRKRVELLLRACQSLPERPELSIVGDGPARMALEREAQQLLPNARFTGDLRGEALEHEFGAAELFVLPGTGGLAVQQALAHGLPVIVAEADGSQADLVTPKNGWRVAPGDLAGLSQALKEASDAPPEKLREMGIESHRIASQQVNIEVMAEVFIQALRRAGER